MPTLSVAAIVGLMASPMLAQTEASTMSPLVIKNDRGGYIMDRLREIRNLRRSGQAVEIRGRVCFSTCTMLLDLPQTCVSPQTTFGFHAPTRGAPSSA